MPDSLCVQCETQTTVFSNTCNSCFINHPRDKMLEDMNDNEWTDNDCLQYNNISQILTSTKVLLYKLQTLGFVPLLLLGKRKRGSKHIDMESFCPHPRVIEETGSIETLRNIYLGLLNVTLGKECQCFPPSDVEETRPPAELHGLPRSIPLNNMPTPRKTVLPNTHTITVGSPTTIKPPGTTAPSKQDRLPISIPLNNMPTPRKTGKPMTPSNPVETTAPSNPVETPAPSNPVETTAPSNPVETTAPSNPVETTAPSNPVETTAPSNPVETTAASNPVETTAPSNPVETTAASNPLETTAASNPVGAPTDVVPHETLSQTKLDRIPISICMDNISVPLEQVKPSTTTNVMKTRTKINSAETLDPEMVDRMPRSIRLIKLPSPIEPDKSSTLIYTTETLSPTDPLGSPVEQKILPLSSDPGNAKPDQIPTYICLKGIPTSICLNGVPTPLHQRNPRPIQPKIPRLIQPKLQNPIQPKLQNPIQPKLQNPIQPKLQNPIQPKLQNPIQPKLQNPIQPKLHDPIQPKLHDPIQPKLHDPIQPKLHDPIQPKLHDPIQPKLPDPIQPKLHDPIPPISPPTNSVESPNAMDETQDYSELQDQELQKLKRKNSMDGHQIEVEVCETSTQEHKKIKITEEWLTMEMDTDRPMMTRHAEVNTKVLDQLEKNNECLDLDSDTDSPSVSRHAEVDAKELDQLEKSSIVQATNKQTLWAINCFKDWLAEKRVLVDFSTIEKHEMNALLRDFYCSVRRGKGGEYCIPSYIGLRAGLNRFINLRPFSRAWCLMKDSEFSSSNKVFIGVLKKIRREGREKTTHPKVIKAQDLEILINSVVLSPYTPKGLVNKVWFDIQLHFGRRGKEGNRQLTPQSFVIKHDENGTKYAKLISKEDGKSYDGADGPNRRGIMCENRGSHLCPVASLEKYLSKIPTDASAFFLHPKKMVITSDSIWYSQEPMGFNYLGSMLPRMCQEAGTSEKYTNHCFGPLRDIMSNSMRQDAARWTGFSTGGTLETPETLD
ncbi:hypothetical protein DPEC_G00179670 [Dallia pectoralis]|uniref:Uncharacterized protein n=1 Tax=Dallia pectoralis TaxID=75939 RepID=A0ACC2GFY2_DALPE|nr:hypothetical protein DPEC_G00179670 [Dallia pectoralis]